MDMLTKAELYLQPLLLVGSAMCTRSVRSSQQVLAAQPQRKRRGKVGFEYLSKSLISCKYDLQYRAVAVC